jgi:hypothetical protein
MEKTKKLICPSCGKIEIVKELIFDCLIIEGKAKEIVKDDINGLKWCSICR